MEHSLNGGLVPCRGVHAFDPSLGVRWKEILSWYLVDPARCLDISMDRNIVQQGLWVTRGPRGP